MNYVDPLGLCGDKSGIEGFSTTLLSAILGVVNQLGNIPQLVQSNNAGIRIAGHHLSYPFKGIGNVAGRLAPWVAVGITVVEIRGIWSDSSFPHKKILKSVTAVSLNSISYVSSVAVIGATAFSGPGVVIGLGATVFIGVGGEYIKSKMYEHIDNNP